MSELRWRAVAATTVMAAMAAWVAVAQVPAPAGGTARAPQAPAPPAAVATVGQLRIAQMELDQRTEQALAQYKSQSGADVPSEVMVVVRRQILEGMIRRNLLVLEAQRRGMAVSEQEAEAELQKDPYFQVNGKFDAARYEQLRTQNPAMLANVIQDLRLNLAARNLMKRLEAEKGPPPAELRATARRELTRAALDYLGLRRSEFDGSYPEPRESEILDYYRTHQEDFHRTQRGTLSVVFVDQPALSDSEAAIPAAVEVWKAGMKQRADSILAAVKAGQKLEEASAPLGGPRPNQIVLPGNFPGYWKGSAATSEAVFSARPGTVLPEAGPAQNGWLVVRVDQVEPAHTAPFREVAREIRSKLRAERRETHEDRELRALYATSRDDLKMAAFRVRYAVVDTDAVSPAAPAAADLDRYYRAHLADYSSFSSKQGGVVMKSFDEVRDEVRRRWLRERRFELARDVADGLRSIWSRGRRDARLEQRLRVREAGPVTLGAPADTGLAGGVLGDSLARRGGTLGAGLARTERGWIAFDVHERIADYVPDFEQARPQLTERLRSRRAQEEEDGARRLFEAGPQQFTGGNVIHYARALVPPLKMLNVPLSRAEVERYYREHLDKYSAPELVAARHILISPRDNTAAAEQEARARADSLLERLRAGDDFSTVAEATTDDPATKENGGDLGVFGRGTMLPEFERAAFAMRIGELSREPVRTQVGYHIIKVYDYEPLVTNPLLEVYANVSSDAAGDKADSLARQRADSLWRSLRNSAQARAAAVRMGLRLNSYDHPIGKTESGPEDLQPYYRRLESVKPGQVYPGSQKIGGMGYVVTWVDSISPPAAPTWDEAREQALDAYRSDAGGRALEAKQAELDSLLQGGWSFDSVAVAWGGLVHADDYMAGGRLVGIGTSGRVDTLVFGTKEDDGLPPGQLSGWIPLLGGVMRLRVTELRPPDANAVTARAQNQGRVETERALSAYFEGLKKRYPVKILDRKLRDVILPQPPPAPR